MAISIGAVAAIAVGGKTVGDKTSVSAFNTCIHQSRFLVLTKQASGGRLIETIRDRAQMNIVGKLAVLPTLRAAESFAGTLAAGGSGAMNGRMVLLTTAAVGRDTNAIQTCGEPEFPPA